MKNTRHKLYILSYIWESLLRLLHLHMRMINMFSLSTLTIYRLTQHFITLGMEKPSWQNMFKETDHNDSHASDDSVSMQFRWNVTPTFYFIDQLGIISKT